MAQLVAPQFARHIEAERSAGRLSFPPTKPLSEGETAATVRVDGKQAVALLRVAARQAAGLANSKQMEVVWVDGDRELAVDLANLQVQIGDGEVHVGLAVRCDQTGPAVVDVVFAVGTNEEPSGLYASTYRRPNGPAPIVGAWGEPLVAFAWQCLLGLVSGIAAAVGKDNLGNAFVPVELTASKREGLQILPMAAHRFADRQTTKAPLP